MNKGRQVLPAGGPNWNRIKTHCPQGHEYTPENTSVWKNRRSCKACNRAAYHRGKKRTPTCVMCGAEGVELTHDLCAGCAEVFTRNEASR
jgi:hypothetical protein